MTRISGFILTAASVLLLAACSGSPSATTPSATAPAAVESDTAGTASTGSATPVSGADVCAYLRGQIPTLEGIGSEVGAMANLTVNLYSWYEQRGAVPNGSQIDEQVAKECPDVATQVYKLAGIKSFASL